MKKFSLLIFALIFSVSFANSQSGKKGLKGPKAKNYKHSKSVVLKSEPLTFVENERPTKGPSAKNSKPWNHKTRFIDPANGIVTEKKKLSSPQYKNYKPWRN